MFSNPDYLWLSHWKLNHDLDMYQYNPKWSENDWKILLVSQYLI